MKLLLARTWYDENWTGGILLLDYKWYGYTLEDPVRFTPKVDGQTAVPAGFYLVTVSMSQRFGRRLPELLNVPGFTGVRIHGGNTAADTQGCILVARERNPAGRIWGSLAEDLTEKMFGAPDPIWIEIINTRQW